MSAVPQVKEPRREACMPAANHYVPQGTEVQIFEHAAKNHLPVLIKGPTGCGKTRFVEHMAERLNRKLFTVACHDDLSAADLVGRHLINAEGTFWQDGPLTRAVREGGICYLDEVVEARKDTTVVLHPLSDHRRTLPVERTGEIIDAHPSFMLVISYNPGYQHLLKGLKPSTRQRFVGLNFDYPRQEQEVAIVCRETGLEASLAGQLVALAHDLRRLNHHDLEEAASTRLVVYAAMMIRSGLSPREACYACMAEPLTDDATTLAAIGQLIHAHF